MPPTSQSGTDLSAYVLSTVDDHLVELRAIRDRLRMGSTVDLGARRELAAESAVLAVRFANRISVALELPAEPVRALG